MPTRDRKPRRRVRKTEADIQDTRQLLELARVATPEQWENGLRRNLVRALIQEGHTEEIAIGIARAFERKPHYIPGRPPLQKIVQE